MPAWRVSSVAAWLVVPVVTSFAVSYAVPMLVFPWGRAVYGPVVAPAPTGPDADALWDLTVAYAKVPYLYELKTPKTDADLAHIGRTFDPYLSNRTWNTVQNPAR